MSDVIKYQNLIFSKYFQYIKHILIMTFVLLLFFLNSVVLVLLNTSSTAV